MNLGLFPPEHEYGMSPTDIISVCLNSWPWAPPEQLQTTHKEKSKSLAIEKKLGSPCRLEQGTGMNLGLSPPEHEYGMSCLLLSLTRGATQTKWREKMRSLLIFMA